MISKRAEIRKIWFLSLVHTKLQAGFKVPRSTVFSSNSFHNLPMQARWECGSGRNSAPLAFSLLRVEALFCSVLDVILLSPRQSIFSWLTLDGKEAVFVKQEHSATDSLPLVAWKMNPAKNFKFKLWLKQLWKSFLYYFESQRLHISKFNMLRDEFAMTKYLGGKVMASWREVHSPESASEELVLSLAADWEEARGENPVSKRHLQVYPERLAKEIAQIIHFWGRLSPPF